MADKKIIAVVGASSLCVANNRMASSRNRPDAAGCTSFNNSAARSSVSTRGQRDSFAESISIRRARYRISLSALAAARANPEVRQRRRSERNTIRQ